MKNYIEGSKIRRTFPLQSMPKMLHSFSTLLRHCLSSFKINRIGIHTREAILIAEKFSSLNFIIISYRLYYYRNYRGTP